MICGGIWWAPFSSIWDLLGRRLGQAKTTFVRSWDKAKGCAQPGLAQASCFPLFGGTLKRTGSSYLTALIIGEDL